MAVGTRKLNQHVPVSWLGIRPEYKKVWSDFPLTAAPFGIQLSAHQLNSLGHMLVAMDLIDGAIDREPVQQKRQQLCESLLDWMNSDSAPNELSNSLDTERLLPLREIIVDQAIACSFLDAAARVFEASERKRNADSVSGLVRDLIDEGQAAAEMTILILGTNSNSRFDSFLQRIMRIGTIVDTLLDADGDFANRLLQIKPGRLFRWRLKAAIARQLPQLIIGFPNRPLLWRYCLSYTR